MSFIADDRIVSRALDRFMRDSVRCGARVVTQRPIQEIIDDLELERHAQQGGLTGRRLASFLDRYLASAPGFIIRVTWHIRWPYRTRLAR